MRLPRRHWTIEFWRAFFRLLWRILKWPHKQHVSWIELILWLLFVLVLWSIVDEKTGGIFNFKPAGG